MKVEYACMAGRSRRYPFPWLEEVKVRRFDVSLATLLEIQHPVLTHSAFDPCWLKQVNASTKHERREEKRVTASEEQRAVMPSVSSYVPFVLHSRSQESSLQPPDPQ